jgi:putative ABC transport system permease protein
MSGAFKLAWRYIMYHRGRSLILMSCIFLTLVLPVCLGILLQTFSRQIVARAEATPVVVGARGSQLDLALHAIYFSRAPDVAINFSEVDKVRKSGLANPIPLHVKFKAQGFPVVGTSLSYFSFRELKIANGESLAVLGDCVVGAAVASKLEIGPGDQMLTDRGSVLDLAGEYPLKLNIVGVLQRTDTPDDSAIFVDLKTAWVIEGLGHGHQDLEEPDDEGVVIGQDGNRIVASAAVLPYTEITESNMASFHFHGDQGEFPITALVIDAPDEKSQTILEGRYRVDEGVAQLVRPPGEIRELMALVFQVKRFFDANAILVALATMALLGLVVMLSLKLRAREMETMFRLGCSRGTMMWIQIAELGLVFLVAICLVAIASSVVWFYADEVVQRCIGSTV